MNRGAAPADGDAENRTGVTVRSGQAARNVEAKHPTLAFEHDTWDFGTILETGGPVEHVFRFTNSGEKPVVVERVGVTCGCMKPTFSQAPVDRKSVV